MNDVLSYLTLFWICLLSSIFWPWYWMCSGLPYVGGFRSCCLCFYWLFYQIAIGYFCADWNGFHNHQRDFHCKNIFILSTDAAISKFCERFKVQIDAYIPHCKNQVPHSSWWFSGPSAVDIAHRSHFLCLYQQSKYTVSKAKFWQASNCCVRVLKNLLNLFMHIKQDSVLPLRNLAFGAFGQLITVF